MLNFTRLWKDCQLRQYMNPFSAAFYWIPGLLRMTAVVWMALLLEASPAQAQVPVEPCPNCVSEDIKLIEVSFKDYDPASCPSAGTPINEDSLRISFNVTSKFRYGFLFVANLYVGGEYKGILYNCYPQPFEQGYREVFLRLPDSLIGKLYAGTKIEVKNVFTAWDNNKPTGKNAGNYRVCNAYNAETNTFDCKMMQDGNSLAPKCKYYSQAFRIKAPAKPEITFDSSQDVTCYGGSNGAIYISVAPTTQDYTYTWTKGGTTYGTHEDLTGAPAGNYTVTVNAQGCTANLEQAITQPEEFKASTKGYNTICYDSKDGSAVVKAEGGTPPYSYEWITSPDHQTVDSATGLGRGTYTVVITDANGCQITRTVTVGSPTQVGFTVTSNTGVSCFGGSDGKVKFKGTGGTGSTYTYSWNGNEFSTKDSAEGLAAGKYGLTVKDSLGCTRTDSITVQAPSRLRFNSITKQNINCYGDSTGSISVTAAGGTSPYKYKFDTATSYKNTSSWSNLGPKNAYALSVQDAKGCTRDTSIEIKQPAAPLSADKDSINVKCKDAYTGVAWVKNIAGGTPYTARGVKPYRFVWKKIGATVTILGSDSAKAVNLCAGTYRVEIRDSACSVPLIKTFIIRQPSTKVDDTVKEVNPVVCYGGHDGVAMVEGSGGTPFRQSGRNPYNYSWSTTRNCNSLVCQLATTDTIKNLSAREYFVRVTDSLGCSIVDSITISGPEEPLEVVVRLIPEYDSVCLGDTARIILDTTSGGTPFNKPGAKFYGYRYKISKILGPKTILYTDTTYVTKNTERDTLLLPLKGPGKYVVTVFDSLGCSATDTVNIVDKGCYRFCNYSQGYFGNTGGLSTFNYDIGGCQEGKSTDTAIAYALRWWARNFTDGLTVGAIQLRSYDGSFGHNPDSIQKIIEFLPGGGPSRSWSFGVFPETYSNGQGNGNTLINQLLTLGLNIGLNSGMYNFPLYDTVIVLQHFNDICAGGVPVSGECYSFKVNPMFVGMTIGQIYDSASAALVEAVESNEKRNRYAEICVYINETFHGCARPVLYCGAPAQQTFNDNYVSNQVDQSTTDPNVLSVKAFPNPFTDNVYFRFKSPVHGDALLEIFDFSGRKLAVQRKSNIRAGEVNQLIYQVPQSSRSQLIYKLSVGKYNAKGILIAPIVQ